MIISNKIFKETPPLFLETERQFSKNFKNEGVFWLGRAATSFLLTYNAIKFLKTNIEKPEVILPSVSCATPANTALVSGLIPRFADINLSTGLIDLNDIKSKVNANTVAILYIHLYGHTHPTDILELKSFCNSKNILLIEDVAQSLGGKINNELVSGNVGDFCIFSFNKTKILETSGGALTVNSKALFDAVLEANDLSKFYELDAKETQTLSTEYRNLHHQAVMLKRQNPKKDISKDFLSIRKKFSNLYYREKFNFDAFSKDFSELNYKLLNRIQKANIYLQAIEEYKQLTILEGWQNSGCCWRFSFLLNQPSSLVDFSESIRKDGFHLSNLYWPVNQFFNPNDECPNADVFSRNIINLWVNEEVSDEWVKNCSDSLITNLKKLSL